MCVCVCVCVCKYVCMYVLQESLTYLTYITIPKSSRTEVLGKEKKEKLNFLVDFMDIG